MLDWLKPILGDAYNEDLEKNISQEIGKAFVSRKDFNDKNEIVKQLEKTIKERDAQLERLKTSSEDIDTLKSTISELQKQNKADKEQYESDLKRIRMDNAVDADEVLEEEETEQG